MDASLRLLAVSCGWIGGASGGRRGRGPTAGDLGASRSSASRRRQAPSARGRIREAQCQLQRVWWRLTPSSGSADRQRGPGGGPPGRPRTRSSMESGSSCRARAGISYPHDSARRLPCVALTTVIPRLIDAPVCGSVYASLDDEEERTVGLLLLGKGAVLARRFERPLAAGLDDQRERRESPDDT